MDIEKVEWISANRIALGLENGLIEIWEIDEEGETTNNRVIKQFKHGNVSLEFLPTLILGNEILGLIWNETTEYLASCSSWDGWIKV